MAEPLRVLMLSKACIVGIYQRKLELIAREGVDLLALVPPSWRDERGEVFLERVYTDGYRLEVLPLHFNGKFHLHYYAGLGRWMREFRPHIVHIDEEPYNLAAWQALYHARKVGAKTLFFSWQNINRRYPFPFRRGERWVLDHIDYALVGTDSAGQVWREKGYNGPMAVVPQFGTDPDLFAPAPEHPARPFTIGFVGRLVEEKGVHLLLDAVAQAGKNDWHLRLVGGGPQLTALQEQTARLKIADRVTFVGQIPSMHMPAEYHNMDTIIMPSLTRPNWKEQFGRVLVEAMASGVPVIGSTSAAIPDVIGDAGLIFPEGNVAALVDCITRLHCDADLYQRLRDAGRARVLDHFTHQQVASATVSVYHQMV